ncbi:MAG: DUF1492 domain-containing protein [Actinomycetota bacterium]
MLTSPPEVVRCLITYADWWQPSSASVLKVGAARRQKDLPEGIPHQLLDGIDERSELCRRMQHLREADRHILFLWYVTQLPVDDIAQKVGVSRRQCFRRRAGAIRTIVRLGQPPN